MNMTFDYKGKCDNCRKDHPSISVLVKRDRGDSGGPMEFWCLKCLDTEISRQQILLDR
jgi:hypothetical protein